jgi:hypothetical protein
LLLIGSTLTFDKIKLVAQKHLARQAGKFVKHVIPAAVKPVHSLWHEILGFIFLGFAGIAAFWVARHVATIGPGQLVLIIPLIALTAGYGVSSFLKARRISRS